MTTHRWRWSILLPLRRCFLLNSLIWLYRRWSILCLIVSRLRRCYSSSSRGRGLDSSCICGILGSLVGWWIRQLFLLNSTITILSQILQSFTSVDRCASLLPQITIMLGHLVVYSAFLHRFGWGMGYRYHWHQIRGITIEGIVYILNLKIDYALDIVFLVLISILKFCRRWWQSLLGRIELADILELLA